MIEKLIPAHTIEIRKYICLGCGLGMECGNPGSGKKHLYVMGHGNQWWCGPVMEIPTLPQYLTVQEKLAGLNPGRVYRYAMAKNGDRIRKKVGGWKWENVEKLLAERERLVNSEHTCSTGECYPICSKGKNK